MMIASRVVVDVTDRAKQLQTKTTSKGNQTKWKIGTKWVKENYLGYEDIAEYLASLVLICSTLTPQSYVKYSLSVIHNKDVQSLGCISPDFRGTLQEKTLGRLLEEYGIDINPMLKGKPIEESLQVLCDVIRQMTGLESEDYLRLLFAFDALILNEDRHLNNIVFLTDGDSWQFAPIFDNGLSLLADTRDYPESTPVTVYIRKVKPRLLSTDFKKHAKLYRGEPFIHKQLILNVLDSQSYQLGRAGKVLHRQIQSGDFDHMLIH